MSTNNPFFSVSLLPYQAPVFDQIRDDDYRPAFDEALRIKRQELADIINNPAAASVENSYLALEKSGRMLARVTAIFFAMAAAHTNDHLQQLDEEFATKLAVLSDEIHLNATLFSRLDEVYQQRHRLGLDDETLRLVDVVWQRFVLAGARLPEADKARLAALNKEAAQLTSQFNRLLLAANKSCGLRVDTLQQLAGLSDADIAAARDAAHAKGWDHGWLLTLLNTTQQPLLQTLADRDTREQLFRASWSRTEKGDSNDTRDIIRRLAALRAEQAHILGFADYASWSIADQMAKTPEAALAFMRNIVPAARDRVAREQADIQALIDQQGGGFQAKAWDWAWYAEQVRAQQYALDDASIRPYFELNNVLERGVFWAASQLFGLKFVERYDLPVYQEDVRVWEIFDHDGRGLGLYYGDFFARDSKCGGAWMGNFVEQSTLLANNPVIYNVCNYQYPADDQPALISWDDVVTLFHEFGHALHGLFASQRYGSLSGTNTPRDFVEFPSQINEHWARHPVVFEHYARHHATGAPMPVELREKLFRASQFNKGYDMTELLAAALLDMNWHRLTPGEATDVDVVEPRILAAEGLALEAVPPRYRSSYFAHVWGGGYAAGYYAYLWTQMLADDGYKWFEEQGGLTRENGQRFRAAILSRGNSTDLAALYYQWRGHDPDIAPMLENRELKH
ncbi:peptidyl-dipeptidase Dcp [Shimwellia pseudoproteus]|uniref:peptidyl-dipeptidase Dcp n=1 Tax=Shimwellia pseudoproteus TaxID=570012 RepID=UPI0018EAB45B|nr:peptidyl-dipeptidase Dcp [Shimwellia pseudoproteus]MBJ3816189.1 peptidyl-dipeptidase Dcp [Shimwellia pseudoproteus]